MVPLIALLACGSVVSLVMYALRPRDELVRRRLLEGNAVNELARQRDLQGGPFKRLVWPNLQRLGGLVANALPSNFVRGIERQLIMAGQPMSVASFFSFWFLFALLLAFVFLAVLRNSSDLSASRLLLLGSTLLAFAAFAPYYALRRRARRRKREIERALPDALDLLVTSVEAGLGVDAAFALVADRQEGPLSVLFTEYLRQVGLGRSRRDALNDVTQRSGVDDLIRLSNTVDQATEVGTSMGDVLRVEAQDLRTRRRQRAQEAAQKAPVYMVIPLATCFIPAMIAVVVVPSILNLLKFVQGIAGGG